jgi:hypothetical protein
MGCGTCEEGMRMSLLTGFGFGYMLDLRVFNRKGEFLVHFLILKFISRKE